MTSSWEELQKDHFLTKLLEMGKGRPRILTFFLNNTESKKSLLEKVHFQIYLMKGQMLKKLHVWPGLHNHPILPQNPT